MIECFSRIFFKCLHVLTQIISKTYLKIHYFQMPTVFGLVKLFLDMPFNLLYMGKVSFRGHNQWLLEEFFKLRLPQQTMKIHYSEAAQDGNFWKIPLDGLLEGNKASFCLLLNKCDQRSKKPGENVEHSFD